MICNDRGRGQSSFPSWGKRRKRSIRINPFKAKLNRNKSADVEEVHELLQVYLTPEEVPEAKKLERTTTVLPLDNGNVCVNKFAHYSLVMMSALFILIFLVLLPYWAVVKLVKHKYGVCILIAIVNVTTNIELIYSQNKHNRFGHWPVGWFHQQPQQQQQQRQQHNHQAPSMFMQRKFASPPPQLVLNNEKKDNFFEPIYSDSFVLERSRSLQSLTVLDANKVVT